jgi:hypothetical protein
MMNTGPPSTFTASPGPNELNTTSPCADAAKAAAATAAIQIAPFLNVKADR